MDRIASTIEAPREKKQAKEKWIKVFKSLSLN